MQLRPMPVRPPPVPPMPVPPPSQFVTLLVLILLVVPQILQPQTIKLGSVAPANSPWGKALQQLAGRWHKLSDGEVKLKLYMGGIAGDEKDMIRKIRIGQLQAGAVTMLGLTTMAPDVLGLSIPFSIQSEEEFAYVLAKTRPYFESKISQKGFTVLTWSFSGWINLFSKLPVIYPDDLKNQTLGVPSEDAELLDAWRGLGFDAVSVSIPDLMIALQSGRIEALYSPPLLAAAFQWFHFAGHISPLKISPVFGAIIVKKSTWDRVSDEYKPALVQAVQEAERVLYTESKRLEQEALAVMQKHGLVVNPVPRDAKRMWRTIMHSAFSRALAATFSKDFFESLQATISDYRNNGGR